MGRPKEFNEEAALASAMHHFWSKGYEASSLQELLTAMKLSKSSFYQTFKSKHDLLERSLSYYRQLTVENMLSNLADAPSGMQFITQTLLAVAAGVEKSGGRRGCLVMNCASEFAQNDPAVARLVAEGVSEFRQVFLAAVKRAQREGDIAAYRDPQTLADYLVSCKSGLETMAKAGATRQQMEEVVHVMISALS